MGFDILHIAVNSDFIFTATKCGIIEVWLKERVTRAASININVGGHTKITSLIADKDGGMLYAGTSDGKIQVRLRNTANEMVEILRFLYSFAFEI